MNARQRRKATRAYIRDMMSFGIWPGYGAEEVLYELDQCSGGALQCALECQRETRAAWRNSRRWLQQERAESLMNRRRGPVHGPITKSESYPEIPF